ncbi:TetR family transcriptional regulator [Stenotrophomonas sp. KCTC 12332]|uniref:TetR family transcriptional regulator n=1 Tax=Stenotrophomonas sp. KCTC 12332 TaxID=1793721 RepID=UPI0018D2452B|nr:TetR family transcriptional regulator [Stenotrophomonas sp. KCTC 12332]
MRKTREQNQLETREKLMAAAAEFIAKGGIGALSLRAICEKAGYSQGLSTRTSLAATNCC